MTTKLAVSHLQVKDVMTLNVYTVTPAMTVKEVVELFLAMKISGAPVVDQSSKVLSVISQTDLIQFIALGGMGKKIYDLLPKLPKTSQVIRVRMTDPFKEVFKQFLIKPVRRVIVTDDTGKLQGIVSKSNLLNAFLLTEANSDDFLKE